MQIPSANHTIIYIEVNKNKAQYKAYERETSSLQVEQGRDGGHSSDSQVELFDNLSRSGAISREQVEQSFKDTYATTRSAEVGTLLSGIDTIEEAEDVAHVLAPYRKHAQETMLALVTDKRGKILEVIRHSKGQKDSACVDPATIAGAILSVDGAASVWLSHNHPSGKTSPSQADYLVTHQIASLLDGTSVSYKGHIILGNGAEAHSFAFSELMASR